MIAFLDLRILGKRSGPPVSERGCHGLVIMRCDTSFARTRSRRAWISRQSLDGLDIKTAGCWRRRHTAIYAANTARRWLSEWYLMRSKTLWPKTLFPLSPAMSE